jgi:hypothetical protein
MQKESALKPATSIEQVAGNPLVQSGLTVVAALSAGPLAALLPVLATTLASERQKRRMEASLIDIDARLRSQEAALRNITDSQYKLLNETILTVLHTTSDEKLSYLQSVINNTIALENLPPHEAVHLSRLLRDLSAQEITFIIDSFSYDGIVLLTEADGDSESIVSKPEYQKTRFLKLNSIEGQTVTGLISLGILAQAGQRYIDVGMYKFMPIAAKLIALLKTSA